MAQLSLVRSERVGVVGAVADPGTIVVGRLALSQGAASAGVDLTPGPNGPLLVDGELTIVGPGGVRVEGSRGALCRCRASTNNPFCDGAHFQTGFETNK